MAVCILSATEEGNYVCEIRYARPDRDGEVERWWWDVPMWPYAGAGGDDAFIDAIIKAWREVLLTIVP